MKSSDAKASKCHLKFSSRMIIFIKLVYLSSVISSYVLININVSCNEDCISGDLVEAITV